MQHEATQAVSRVLLVDSEAGRLRALACSLEDVGLEIDLAAGGQEAVRLASSCSYAVVVTELQMSSMDGIALVQHLHSIHPAMSFIVQTGEGDGVLQRDYDLDPAFVTIHSKPWTPEEVISSVQQAVAAWRKRLSGANDPLRGAAAEAILVIEDDPADAELISRAIRRAMGGRGKPARAERLSEALELVRDNEYLVVLTDLSLPDAQGLDSVTRLHAAAPQTPIIVLSGSEDEELALQAIELGAQDYLVKGSFDRASIERSIRYAVQRKRSQQQVARLAHFDQLTGLANRATFRTQLNHAISRSTRRRESLAVMFLDLDRFKSINDTLGHHAGDQLLQEVGARLRHVVRDYDSVGRLGGDEFAILMEPPSDPASASLLAGRILDELRKPIRLGGNELVITSSIGIAPFPECGTTSDELLRAADTAMYAAKKTGRNKSCVSTRESREEALRQNLIDRELPSALARNEFVLHYQPQYDLRNGKLSGVEALLRWQRPGQTLISPADFIPALETSGLIHQVGQWVLRAACKQLKVWNDQGVTDITMAVNMSPRQFEEPDLFDLTCQVVEETGINPSQLEIEITESTLMRDTVRTKNVLSQLQQKGIRIAIDDFGTGYSSLAYLGKFAVDVLKIDRSFVASMEETSEHGRSIAAAIIGLGRAFDLDVVAEGIETPSQAQQLVRAGCNVGQGYLLGRPAEPHALDLKAVRPTADLVERTDNAA